MEVQARIRQHYSGAAIWDAFVNVLDGEPRCVWHRWFRTELAAQEAVAAEIARWTSPHAHANSYGMASYLPD